MRYATMDKNNKVNAFYSEDINGPLLMPDPLFKLTKNQTLADAPLVANPNTQIPTNAVLIPDAVWRAHIQSTEQVYDGVKKTWTAYVPTSAEKLADASFSMIAEIQRTYQTALNVGVSYRTFTFQSDEKSISTLTEVLTSLSNGWVLPLGFAWIDSSNVPHPASVIFLKGLSTALANHKSALFTRLQIAKAAIATAKTVTAINKVVL